MNNNPKYNNLVKHNMNKNPMGFMNHLAQKKMNYNNEQSKGITTPKSTQKASQKKNLRLDLQKGFDAINEDFIYIPPIFIPLIPGNDLMINIMKKSIYNFL